MQSKYFVGLVALGISLIVVSDVHAWSMPHVPPPGRCFQQLDRGDTTCRSTYTLKYYYDEFTYSCKPFYYRGCGGNANRFKDEKSCRLTCIDRPGPIGPERPLNMRKGGPGDGPPGARRPPGPPGTYN